MASRVMLTGRYTHRKLIFEIHFEGWVSYVNMYSFDYSKKLLNEVCTEMSTWTGVGLVT